MRHEMTASRHEDTAVLKYVAVAIFCVVLCACAETPQQAPSVAIPPAPPSGEPAGLTGIDAQAVRAAFGPPAFVRKDGQVEMWRYDSPLCKAFFFLYPSSGALSVRHVETQPRGSEIAADETCLARLRVRGNAPVS
jgi:hypothetical protein